MFEFNQLRCFVAVSEDLHFGRAAVRLNMSQPPLSRQVQSLEQEMGVALLERTSRSVRLTAAGRAFLPEARRLLRLAEGATVAAKRVARGEAGSMALGFTAGASYAFLPRMVMACAAEMPNVDLVLREMPTRDQIEALAGGRLDLGLVRLPVDRRGIDVTCVAREPMLLATPEGHPLAIAEAAPSFRDLDQTALIMYSPTEGRYFYDLTSSLFRSTDIAPQYVQHIGQIHTILALVSAGMGLALVPESAAGLLVRGVVLRKLVPASHVVAELQLVWRRNQDNPALQVFRSLVLPKLVAE
jgi:DNA-binding transcriptional LysR family regulator